MADPLQPEPTPSSDGIEPEKSKARKEKVRGKNPDKMRAAWISLGGRIAAQVIGAVVTIVLGLVVARYYSQAGNESAAEPSAAGPRLRVDRTNSAVRGQLSVAVLPLSNFSSDPERDYFADGMTEALIAHLAQAGNLRVISRTSVMAYKGKPKPVPQIAQELNVDAIVEGSVVLTENRVRITAQLIDGRTDEHLWAKSYERPLRDVLALQAEIAETITRSVDAALAPRTPGSLPPLTVDPAAYDAYLRGRQGLALGSPQSVEAAVREFEAAIRLDPKMAVAHAGLAQAWSSMGSFTMGSVSPRDAMKRAGDAARVALELNDQLPEAHLMRAWIKYRYEWDWAEAERGMRRALELSPGLLGVHEYYALFLSEQGRDLEAQEQARLTLDLDPLSPGSHRVMAVVHLNARRFAIAEPMVRKSIELQPSFLVSHLILSWSLIGQGKFKEAEDILLQVRSTESNPEVEATLGYIYARTARSAEATRIRRRLAGERPVVQLALARVCLGLNENDAALDALEAAADERADAIALLRVNFFLDPLRSEPRFAALMNRVGLQ